MRNLKWIIKNSFKLDKPMFIYLSLYVLFKSIPDITMIIGSRYLLDSLTMNSGLVVILQIILISASIFVFSSVVSKLFYNISWPRYIVIRMKLKKLAAKKYVSLKQSTIENPNMLNLCERAEQATTFNENGFEGMFRQSVEMISLLLSLVTCFFIISSINIFMSLIIPVLVITSYAYNMFIRKHEKNINDELIPINRMNEYFFNITIETRSAKDIRIFNLLPLLIEKINLNIKIRRSKQRIIENKRLNFAFVNTAINVCLELILYIWLIYSVLYHNMSIGTFTMSAAAVRTIFSQLSGLLNCMAHVRQQSLLMNDFIALINFEEEGIQETDEDTFINNKKDKNYVLQLQNVGFKYPNSDKYALHNISLTINSGQKIAIVGPNGSGKTTFVKILTKLYEPTEGEILLNGNNINKLNRFEYYHLFSTVFQEIVLFAFPVIENISIKPKQQTDQEKAVDCCQDAMLHDKIMTFSKKYDTSVLKITDEEGIDFSGGEKQKVALARSIYRDAPVMLLDEPSANLDAIAESNVYHQYNKFSQGKSSVFISHRLASTQFCDLILLFDNGEIIERGTHEELMNQKGLYMEMFNIQAKHYND